MNFNDAYTCTVHTCMLEWETYNIISKTTVHQLYAVCRCSTHIHDTVANFRQLNVVHYTYGVVITSTGGSLIHPNAFNINGKGFMY